MYKRQVRLQKFFCLLAIIASALVFVYSLGLVTDLYEALYGTMPYPEIPEEDYIAGARIFYNIQGFNTQLMLSGLGLIIVSLGLYITQTHKRRRYYIGNYCATGIWVAAALGVCGWMHVRIQAFKAEFLKIDFAALAEYAETKKKVALTADDTFWFDIHYAVMAIVILVCAVLVANVFWKISLMKQEAALLAGAPAKEQGSAPAKVQ